MGNEYNIGDDYNLETSSANNKKINFKHKCFIVSICALILLLTSLAVLTVIALVQVVKVRSELDQLQDNSSLNPFTQVKNQIDQSLLTKIGFLEKKASLIARNSSMEIINQLSNEISNNISADLEDFYIRNISKVLELLTNLPIFSSCADALQKFPFSTSGYQLIWHNGSFALVYCDMTLSCGGVTGGWRRMAYINTAISGTLCPSELTNRNDPSSCIKSGSAPGCSSVKYPSNGISYSRICGRVNGLEVGIPDAFQDHSVDRPTNATLEENYVDGVSLTYGSNPRTHIWTLAIGTGNCAVCNNERPGYIENDYSCEINDGCVNAEVCSTKVLWNGNQCVGGKMFYKELQQRTTEDIEMRVCRDQSNSDEDILITFVELYVQ